MKDLNLQKEQQLDLSKRSKKVYLPGLNGLRAIAALAVVVYHITLALDEFGFNNRYLELIVTARLAG